MEILPVNDLDVALHNFVNKDDKMAFYSCVQYNLEETRVSSSSYAPLLYESSCFDLYMFSLIIINSLPKDWKFLLK